MTGLVWPLRREDEDRLSDAGRSHVRALCLFCGFETEGSLEQTRGAMKKHRERRHPDVGKNTPRKRGGKLGRTWGNRGNL